jgi:epoxyqueuosine reductase
MTLTAADIKRQATHLGFDLCGVAAAEDHPELDALTGWLRRGFAGRMTYLNRTAKKRADARRWLPSARSVICVACVYHADRPLSVEVGDPGVARIARYAWGDDYHNVLTARLEALLAWMREVSGEPFEARLGVDDAPVQERVYALAAGLGWIGKHTCLINPARGSWIVLGEIATSLPLEPDGRVPDRCGTCTLCLDACPTGAIVEPYVVDARRCLSYLTIEIKKDIPEAQRPSLGSHVFGCDICQDVCPYNAAVAVSRDPGWTPRPALDQPRLTDLWRASDAELEEAIAGTALRRRGVAGLRRNVAVALGNAGPAAASVLREGLRDAPTAGDPVVAGHVAWAPRRHE